MTINLIAAVGRSGQIGLDGALPWHDPKDLAWFRRMTAGGVVIMGMRTLRALPDTFDPADRVMVPWSGLVTPFSVVSKLKERFPERALWVAGGAYTYEAFMPYVERAYIARMPYDGPATAIMPPLWTMPAREVA